MSKRLFFLAVLLACLCFNSFAQNTEGQYSWELPPQKGETEIGIITDRIDGGWKTDGHSGKGDKYYPEVNNSRSYSTEQLYEELFKLAEEKYKKEYPRFSLRSFSNYHDYKREEHDDSYDYWNTYYFWYDVSAIVVTKDAITLANENLSKVLDKALRNVHQGARISIDQVTVTDGVNREDYIDNTIDILLDKGYKVVAKEYLNKLWEEQQNQRSGIFNDRTTVQDNNFSAVGYFLNLKITDSAIRVQVINVSTGEYEGNSVINF